LLRVYAHHQFLSEQIAEVEAERRALRHTAPETSIEKVRQLMQLKGIGINGAWLLVMAFFGWRTLQKSALSCWFKERFGSGGKRLRRIGIVAVARKLFIALWRFLETGALPEAAVLKEA